MRRFYIPKFRRPTVFTPYRPVIVRTILSICVAYVLIVASSAFLIYNRHVSNGWTSLGEKLFPFPATSVNGETVSLVRFRKEVAARHFYTTKHNLPTGQAEIENYVVTRLTNHLLFAQALQKNGIILTEADVDKRMREIYVEIGGEDKMAKYLSDNYGSSVSLTDFRQWIKDSLMEAAIQHQLLVHATIRHILISLPENPSDKQVADARARIVEVRKKIANPSQFAQVAKDYSEDVASRDNGGSLGSTNRGNGQPVFSQEFQDAVFSLPIGQVSEPLRTSYGWHLVMVDEREGKINESFAEYTAELRAGAKVRELVGK